SLNGVLDEFRWYDRALTAQEVMDTYDRELPLSTGPNDATVLSLDSPIIFCAGPQDVYATIGNYGTNQIDSVEVHWELNGVPQPSYFHNQLLDTINGSFPNTAQVNIGSGNFAVGSNSLLIYTS